MFRSVFNIRWFILLFHDFRDTIFTISVFFFRQPRYSELTRARQLRGR